MNWIPSSKLCSRISHLFPLLSILLVCALSTGTAFAQQFTGTIFTTDKTGPKEDNRYEDAADVYLTGGPANKNGTGLPNGTYYFQVTDPSGDKLLSTDNAECRQLTVANGKVAGAAGPSSCRHASTSSTDQSTPVQLTPFLLTPSEADAYKVWLIRKTGSTAISTTDPKVVKFDNANAKTDSFKIKDPPFTGNIFTTDKTGPKEDNRYENAGDVYLTGGPANKNGIGLPNGTYYFQVTDPSGDTLLSTDNAECRQLTVANGRVAGPAGPACRHASTTSSDQSTPVQLVPFLLTPAEGDGYKVWLIRKVSTTSISTTNPKVVKFDKANSKTDSFKIKDPPFTGTIFTTNKTGPAKEDNKYDNAGDPYLTGGPLNKNGVGLPSGTYYFQVTDPAGSRLLSTDNAVCRQLTVTNGRVAGATGPDCRHTNGSSIDLSTPVQLAPFLPAPNDGGVYKVWLIRQNSFTSISPSNPKVVIFRDVDAKTDNFKVTVVPVPPAGSCQAASSLSVLVTGQNVVSYVAKGAWSWEGPEYNGIGVVNVEGASITPKLITTPNSVNSCASNSVTGQTICTANNKDVYVISPRDPGIKVLSTDGLGMAMFFNGSCTNCGVAMDATRNRAVISYSIDSMTTGFRLLDLGPKPKFGPAIPSRAPDTDFVKISEAPMIDPVRNLILSPNEYGTYEIVKMTDRDTDRANDTDWDNDKYNYWHSERTQLAFYENATPPDSFRSFASSGEDCTTGIALGTMYNTSPGEPSHLYITDLTQATASSGTPGTWSAPFDIQTLDESFLEGFGFLEGGKGVAVAQGTHTGILTGRAGGDTITAISLPKTSGSGTPKVEDWVTCRIGVSGFTTGEVPFTNDPHTVNAYRSPNNGHAVGLVANFPATKLAAIDLTKMLDPTIVARTPGGHACSNGVLPAGVVGSIPVPVQ